MNPIRQGRIGVSLATAIIGAWTLLHGVALFAVEPGSVWLSVVLVLALSWLSVGLFIVAHDAMHGSLWPANRPGGDRIGALALFLYAGFSYRRLLPKHHAHHRQPGSPEDPDFAPHAPSQALKWYGRFMVTYFGWRELAGMALRTGVYLLLGAPMENILLFFALPGLLSSFQLFYFGTFLPHRHLTDGATPQFPDRHHARSNEYGYLLSLLTCFHFGYHHEHHLHPGAPWWRLPAMREERQA